VRNSPTTVALPEATDGTVGRLRAFWRRTGPGLAVLASACALACTPSGPVVHRVGGRALGTTWSVVVVDDDRSSQPATLEALVNEALDEVDRAASTWREDSELARFARLAPGESMPLSEHLRVVLDESRVVHEESGGAFDPTVAPLVALYGFGAGARDATTPPSEEERAEAHARVDFGAVRWDTTTLSRTRPDVTLDLSAIAKGYAVDVIAARLRAAGELRFLAEVGGELVLSGTRVSGDPWVVGVYEPVDAPVGPPGALSGPVHLALGVSDRAVATSGDYRQYHTDAEGRQVTHAIDPRAGRAVSNEVASVTVIALNCMRADALATAVMVLGADEGLALLERLPDVEGFLLLHTAPSGAATQAEGGAPRFEERETSGFAPYRLPAKR
jgi:thiamine biosynthesis lipoprotein